MSMKLADLVEKIKQETDIAKVGMIVCHNGVVRGTTRDGIQAEYLEISVDASAMHKVLEDMRREPGIAAVEAYIHTGRRNLGDDVMLVASRRRHPGKCFPRTGKDGQSPEERGCA